MRSLLVILAGLGLILAGCGAIPGASGTPTIAPEPPTQPPLLSTPTQAPGSMAPAQQAAIASLAKGLGIPESRVSVVTAEPVIWPNGCMGVQRIGVMCTLNKVPGFRFVLSADNTQYEVHTNEEGTAVVPEQPQQAPGPAEQVAIKQLAHNLGIADSDVTVVSSTLMEWPDSCLGVAQEGVMCAQIVTPGWLFVLEASGRQYEYHTNQDASVILPATRAMDWKEQGGVAGLCEGVTVYLSGEIYGLDCRPGGDGRMGVLTAAQRTQLYGWMDQFTNTTIDLSDPKGAADAMTRTADLFSNGQQVASPQDKRAIFDFGQSLYQSLYP